MIESYKVTVDTLTNDEVVDKHEFIILWWPEGNDHPESSRETQPYFRVCRMSPHDRLQDRITDRIVSSVQGTPTLDVILKTLASVVGNELV